MTYKFQLKDSQAKMASFLKEALGKDFSSKSIKRAIEKGCCRVNGRVVSYANHLLKKGDQVEISLPIQPKSITIATVYEDDCFLIINKPSGVVSEEKELKKFFSFSVYLVHRLDKETSGLLILAKTQAIKKSFEQLFKDRQITKKYLALVDGVMANPEGCIELALEMQKKAHHATCVKVVPGEGTSKTFYKTLGIGKNASFVEFDIVTGKTHQIRVHASYLGHPVLGDPVYLKKPVCTFIPESLCLHAAYISFYHPVTGQKISKFQAPPLDFMRPLKVLIPNAKLPSY